MAVTATRTDSAFMRARDGTRLAVRVDLGAGAPARPRPAAVRMTRYPPDADDPAEAARLHAAGFGVVVVAERGTGESGGARLLPWSQAAGDDAADVAAWIARQPWCNGRVAAYGASYDGGLAEAAGAAGSPALAAVAPWFIGADPYADIVYPGGVFNRWFMQCWSDWNGALEPGGSCAPATAGIGASTYVAVAVAPFRDDPLADSSYAAISGLGRQAAIARDGVAVIAATGWFDSGFARGALERFLHGSGSQLLVIGPWNHGGSHQYDPLDHGAHGGSGADVLADLAEELARELDRPGGTREVRYYTVGGGGWRTTEVWPPRGVESASLGLAAGGRMTGAPAEGPPTRHTLRPDTSSGLRSRWRTSMCGFAIDYEGRDEAAAELLAFTSPQLAEPLTITGSPWMALWLSSTEPDVSVFAYLDVLAPDGSAAYVTEGQLRARHRATVGQTVLGPLHSFARADARPLAGGEVAELRVGLLPISARVPAGHRLRLTIAGADADTFETVPGGRPVEVAVHHDRSALHLPVAGGEASLARAVPGAAAP